MGDEADHDASMWMEEDQAIEALDVEEVRDRLTNGSVPVVTFAASAPADSTPEEVAYFIYVEGCCVVLHDAYESAAVQTGWLTNPRSRVPWDQVPESNKQTMRIAVRALLEHIK